MTLKEKLLIIDALCSNREYCTRCKLRGLVRECKFHLLSEPEIDRILGTAVPGLVEIVKEEAET